MDQKLSLDRLPYADGATYDSHAEEHNPKCHPDTRVELLTEIHAWVGNPEAESIFWLSGMAGTGKSTISRTIAESLSKSRQLGASFFFKRGEGDRGRAGKFFTTIAKQLAHQEPSLAPILKSVLDEDPSIIGKNLYQQFEKLIREPCSEIFAKNCRVSPLVIVVDALDECEGEENMKAIIDIFSRTEDLGFRLQILLTSRPELPIRLGFGSLEDKHQRLLLHEIPEHVVEHDILIFLEYEIAKIRDNHNSALPDDQKLPTSGPDAPALQVLVKMASPLFIFAATVCRFLQDSAWNDPQGQLEKVLRYHEDIGDSELDGMEATYRPVLDQLLVNKSGRARDSLVKQFQDVVGPIILLAQPLPISSLENLLQTRRELICGRLSSLHSVFKVPPQPDEPIRIFHKSFLDYLLDIDKRETNPFWIDERQTHKLLAEHCITILNKTLHRDICDFKFPAAAIRDREDSTWHSKIQPEIQYACQYWAYHVVQSKERLHDGDGVYQFLAKHFLHWLEAMCLLSRGPETIDITKSLQRAGGCTAVLEDWTKLSAFLCDSTRFILANINIATQNPLQIYYSALVFAPKTSIIRQTFQDDYPKWLNLSPQVDSHWSLCLQTLEGHAHWVDSVAFSHDAKLIVSSGHRYIHLWSVERGAFLKRLQGRDNHKGSVTSVRFSHDSSLILSASEDRTIKVWSTGSGLLVRTITGHSRDVLAAEFSHDSKLIASGSRDETARIWFTDTGTVRHTLKGHTNIINAVKFTSDSKLVATASNDANVMIWSVNDGLLLLRIRGHGGLVSSVAFTSDRKLIASGCSDGMVRTWSTNDGALLNQYEGHGNTVTSVVFSHDSKFLISGSQDKTIKIWSNATGELRHTLEGHRQYVTSVDCSFDSALVASGSFDQTVRIWSIDTEQPPEVFERHTDWVRTVIFSEDDKFAGSIGSDTARIWSAETGLLLHELKNRHKISQAVAFSKDSKFFASQSQDCTITLCSTGATGAQHYPTLQGHSESALCISVSDDSRLVASASQEKKVRIWSVKSGELQITIDAHCGHLGFSNDTKLLAGGSYDNVGLVWSVDNGALQQTLDVDKDLIYASAFSGDLNLIATTSYNESVRIWSVATGACLAEFEVEGIAIGMAFIDKKLAIRTKAGALYLNIDCSFHTESDIDTKPSDTTSTNFPIWYVREKASLWGCGVVDNCNWITMHGRRLLWVPTEYRSYCATVSDTSVVIGSASGRVIFMRFSPEIMQDICPPSDPQPNHERIWND
jgi:WD40 repeat protein